MAIVKMSKFTLLSFENHKDELLKKLHIFGDVEFENLGEKSNDEFEFLKSVSSLEEVSNYEAELAKVNYSIQKISPFLTKPGMIQGLKEGKRQISFEELEKSVNNFDYTDIYSNLKKLDANINEIKNKKSKLEGEIEFLAPFSNLQIALKDLRQFKMASPIIGYVPLGVKSQMIEDVSSSIETAYVEVISEDKDNAYLAVVTMTEKALELEEILRKYNFNKVNLNYDSVISEEIKSLNTQISELTVNEGKVQEEITKFADYNEKLEECYEYFSNMIIRSRANENFLGSDNVVVINGWLPTESEDNLRKICKDVTNNNFFIEVTEAEKDSEEVPIKLRNNKIVSAFESITSMYALPKYNEIDPTPMLTIFYAVFFGMMLADAGYGLVMLIGSLVVLKTCKLTESMKKSVQFFMYLSIPTIVVGLIYGSVFGDMIPIPALIDPTKDYNAILISSLVLGIIQILSGLALKAYVLIRNGTPLDAVYDVGSWIITFIGIAILAVGTSIGLWIMLFGMLMVVLTQGRQAPSIGGKIGSGLYELYGITGYLSDLVSYTRLMALGLAGGSIAGAINLILSSLTGNFFGIVIAAVLFIGLQLFNLGLSALGAYVHSIRLQYVEFFSKFYEGGGREFKPLKTTSKYLDVKND